MRQDHHDPRTPPAFLLVGPEPAGALRDALRRAAPREGCGLLLGHVREGGLGVVDTVREVRNRAPDPGVAFAIDPLDLLAAVDDAAAAGGRVLGTWHTHPTAPAVPSAADVAALWPEHVMVIVGAAGGLRAWRPMAGSGIVEVVLTVAEVAA